MPDYLTKCSGWIILNGKYGVIQFVVLYRMNVWQEKSLVKMYFGKIKFGKNIKILITVVELQNVWQIKFGDLVKFATLLSYTVYCMYCSCSKKSQRLEHCYT